MTIRRWMKWTALGGAVAVLTAGVFVHHARAQGHFRGHHGKMFERVSSLGITTEQWEKIHAVMAESKPKAQPLVKQLVQERRALRQLVLDGATEADIRAQVNKVAAVGADLAVIKAQTVPQSRAVLTPEQQEKVKEMMAEFDDRVDGFVDHLGNVD